MNLRRGAQRTSQLARHAGGRKRLEGFKQLVTSAPTSVAASRGTCLNRPDRMQSTSSRNIKSILGCVWTSGNWGAA